MDMGTALQTIGGVLVAAFMYSYVFFKKNAAEGEEFDPSKTKRTILMGLITGLVLSVGSWYWNLDMDATAVFLTANTGGFWTVLIDKAVSWLQAKYFS